MNFLNKLSFIEKFLGKSKYSSNTREALFYCPYCKHHKPKLSINLETDKWQCFPCGKKGGSLSSLIKDFGNSSLSSQYFSDFVSSSVKTKSFKPDDIPFSLPLPSDFSSLVDCRNSLVGINTWNYLVNFRGLTEEDILFYKIGLTNEGILLPSFNAKGEVNFYTIRHSNGAYFSPVIPKGYKNTIIPNELNIDWEKPVKIVEGFFDMVKSGGNSIPLFGSLLSKNSKIFTSLVHHQSAVYMALDTDAKEKSLSIARKFLKFGLDVFYVDIRPFKDPGLMTKDQFNDCLRLAKPVTKIDLFLHNLCSF